MRAALIDVFGTPEQLERGVLMWQSSIRWSWWVLRLTLWVLTCVQTYTAFAHPSSPCEFNRHFNHLQGGCFGLVCLVVCEWPCFECLLVLEGMVEELV